MKTFHLCNSAEAPAPVPVIGVCNAFSVDEHGWAEIRYGDYEHDGRDGFGKIDLANSAQAPAVKRVVQRFTRENAQAFVADFKSLWGRVKRAVSGKSIYLGHPDAPRFARQFPDKTPRGAIADMEAGETAFRFRPILTEQGTADVERGYREFSPNWGVTPVSLARDGTLVVSPVVLTSIGLVRQGNIPGLSLTNAATAATTEHQENTNMPQWLIDLLIGAGLLKAGQAGEDTARTALANHFTAHETTVQALGTIKEQVAALTTEKTTLVNSVSAEKTRADTAGAALEAERKERATLLVAAAVSDGRVPAADKEAKITALCNAADFAAAATALAALKPALRTTSRLASASGARSALDATARQGQVIALVNARMGQTHEDYATAFAAVQADPLHGALFGVMKRAAS